MSRSPRPRAARVAVLVAVAAAAATAGAGLGSASLATAAPTAAPTVTAAATGGAFVPLAPSRVIDTRIGVGAPKAKVGAGMSITSTMVDRTGLPAAGTASAVVLNLTATNGSLGGFLTAYPAGITVPDTSSVNFTQAYPTANLVTVPLSSDGRISIYNRAGTADVVADVVGYYAKAENATYGGLQPVEPYRAYDSRKYQNERYGDGDAVDIYDDFDSAGFDLNSTVTGWVVNVTSVGSTSDGYVTAWDGAGKKPPTSSLNFRKGVTTANLVEVKAGTITDKGKTLPRFTLQTTMFGGTTDLVVDVVGLYTKPTSAGGAERADARFRALSSPMRIVDTRSAEAPNLGQKQTRTFSASAVSTDSTVALAANLTSVNPTLPTYIAINGGTAPTISSLNIKPGSTRANGAVVELGYGADDSFQAYNLSGTTPLIVDVAGTFELPAVPAAAPRRTTAAAAAPWSAGTPGHRVR